MAIGEDVAFSPGDLVCEWFALCMEAADGVVRHPVLGLVPACGGCAGRAGEPLLLLEGQVLEWFVGGQSR